MKYTSIFILIFLFCHASYAQSEDSLANLQEELEVYEDDSVYANQDETEYTSVVPQDLSAVKEYQDKKLNIKNFDSSKWKKMIGTTDYSEKPPKIVKENEASKPWSSQVLLIIFYAIIIAIVILLLYLVYKNTSFSFKFKANKVHADGYMAPIDKIEDLDIQLLLKQALDAGNFKLAVRLYYLGLLKKLNEAGIIEWKKDKTNRDYLSTLFAQNYHYEEISKLTQAYEQVWYGEHTLTADSFKTLSSNFISIDQRINVPGL